MPINIYFKSLFRGLQRHNSFCNNKYHHPSTIAPLVSSGRTPGFAGRFFPGLGTLWKPIALEGNSSFCCHGEADNLLITQTRGGHTGLYHWLALKRSVEDHAAKCICKCKMHFLEPSALSIRLWAAPDASRCCLLLICWPSGSNFMCFGDKQILTTSWPTYMTLKCPSKLLAVQE